MNTVDFEQVILRGCGIDVHKDVVVATMVVSVCLKEKNMMELSN
ncbi:MULTISPECIES: hypothetical protein [Parabacteroides]|nr:MULTISPECIES: hypothetical protein [Parabacteroides]